MCAIFCLAPATHADTISLIDGRTIEGKISFDAKDGLLVVPRGQPSQRIEVRDVLALQVDSRPGKPPRRQVTLVSGATIAGTQLLMLNDRELRLKRADGSIFTTNASVVSAIDFRPGTPLKLPAGNVSGVIVGEGDVSEGDILSVVDGEKDEGEVKLSSVLFGLQSFNPQRELRAVMLRPLGVSRAAYLIHTTDGSTLHASELRVDRGKLLLETDVAGQMQVPGDQVRSIELGPASADDLSTLTTASPGGAIALQAGASIDLALGGRYRAMVLTVSVPSEFMPSRSVTFVILADGKEVSRTAALTSVDPAATITRATDGVKVLTVRAEASEPQSLGVGGRIDAGRLIRVQ